MPVSEPLLGHAPSSRSLYGTFTVSICTVITVLLIGTALFTRFSDEAAGAPGVERFYMYLVHVLIMVFGGFGFLMTFLRRFQLSAVGLNFFLSCLTMAAYLLVGGGISQGLFTWKVHAITIDLPLVINAAFCAGAAMITFGAVLGKLTPTQLLWLLVLEVPMYALNEWLSVGVIGGLDMGGSITIHTFGAYFGLAASLVASRAVACSGSSHPKNRGSYSSDVTAMVGTILLFIFWPSFNGALASLPDDQQAAAAASSSEAAAAATAALSIAAAGCGNAAASAGIGASAVDYSSSHHGGSGRSPSSHHDVIVMQQQQFRCIVNTVTSLLGACLATFAASAAVSGGKFNIVHVQNATLAGGVAIGASANLVMSPSAALFIGVLAGTISTLGFAYLMPFLERTIGLRDTCGVHNLHGIPGVLGGLAAAVVSVSGAAANAPLLPLGAATWAHQVAAVAATLAVACLGGALSGLVITRVHCCSGGVPIRPLSEDELFEDAIWWHCDEGDVESESAGPPPHATGSTAVTGDALLHRGA